jgi:uncharacterized protein YbjQ (UPF0145 family)
VRHAHHDRQRPAGVRDHDHARRGVRPDRPVTQHRAGCLAGFRSLAGGEIPQFTKLLSQSRNEAMARMVAEAQARGANAITAMRFDSGAIGQWSEICAYGTAVTAEPRSDAARQQHDAVAASGQFAHQEPYATRVGEWSAPST